MASITLSEIPVNLSHQAVCDALLAQHQHAHNAPADADDPTDYATADTDEPTEADRAWWAEITDEDAFDFEPLPTALGWDHEPIEWEAQELAEAGVIDHMASGYPLW